MKFVASPQGRVSEAELENIRDCRRSYSYDAPVLFFVAHVKNVPVAEPVVF